MAAICVGGAHLLIFWLIWDIHYEEESVVEDFAGVLLFVPTTSESPRPRATDKRMPRVQRPYDRSQDSSDLAATPSSSISLPVATSTPTAPAAPDWQQALESVATDVISQAQEDAARMARIGRPPPSASFEPLHARPHDLAWVGQHSREIINAQGVPEWVLFQPCAVVILPKEPDCTVEHVERHGFTYEFIEQQHDATLGYDGPNAVP